MIRRAATLLPLAACLLLPGCAVADMTQAINQLSMTPDAATFRTLDCDADGALTQAEVGARVFLRTSAAPSLHQVTPEEFRAGDANKDLKWSQAEFTTALTAATAWSVSPNGCGR